MKSLQHQPEGKQTQDSEILVQSEKMRIEAHSVHTKCSPKEVGSIYN